MLGGWLETRSMVTVHLCCLGVLFALPVTAHEPASSEGVITLCRILEPSSDNSSCTWECQLQHTQILSDPVPRKCSDSGLQCLSKACMGSSVVSGRMRLYTIV